ncbi:hypothetical protein GO986_17740 [Deinococcus sp. HMF7620]|uniref:Uncharacterized protein n=1 Tax=Deinococcus arboris TaxID=2682977 RepID=A0A7C9LSY9_9DEIO|nr:hypothetical protein [Deinococcus arboris]MVN88581.1 hypothetical protein [Deinococcus arboris]
MTTAQPESLLDQLETALRPHAHGMQALDAIRSFVKDLKNTKARAELLNSAGALVTRPIDCAEAKEIKGYPNDADTFWVLAGDIVSTDAAFTLGERVTSDQSDEPRPKFIVANSTCDLIPGRKKTKALLLEVHPIYKPTTEEQGARLKNQLGALLSFRERHYMYLPPLPGDPEDVIANVVSFNDFAIMRVEDLPDGSGRKASLSTPGWRIFAALLRMNLSREGEHEAEMRTRLNSHYSGIAPTIGTGMKA